MPVVRAEFDGRVFVPTDPVEVPAGTKVEVLVPPPPPTPEQQARWEEVKRQIDASEPHFPTLDEAMRCLEEAPVILLDSDVILLDRRYPNDPRYAGNLQALQQLWTGPFRLGIMQQAILEIVGILSFNVAPSLIPTLLADVTRNYRLTIVPDPIQQPDYAGCTIQEVLLQINRQMSLADAVQAVQIARYASAAVALLTWNARHFVGKMAVPVLTPQEWLNQQAGLTP